MAAGFEHGFGIPALKVGHVYSAFFAGCEYGDDAAEGDGALYMGKEVDDEAGTGVVSEG